MAFSLFGEIYRRQGGGFFSKFQVRHEGCSFDSLRESDEGADKDLISRFCWPFIKLPYIKHTICDLTLHARVNIWTKTAPDKLCMPNFIMKLQSIFLILWLNVVIICAYVCFVYSCYL